MMTQQKESAEKAIRDIRQAKRRQYYAEEKIRIRLSIAGWLSRMSALGHVHPLSIHPGEWPLSARSGRSFAGSEPMKVPVTLFNID